MTKGNNIFHAIRRYLITTPRTIRPADIFRPLERWGILLIIFVVAVVIIAPPFYFDYHEYSAGKPINETIKAPFTVKVVDSKATEELKKSAEETYTRYYEYNSMVRDRIINDLEQIFAGLREIENDEALTEQQKREAAQGFLQKEYGLKFNEEQADILLLLSENEQTTINVSLMFDELFSKRGVVSDLYAYQSFERRDVVVLTHKALPPPQRLNSSTMLAYPEEVRDFLQEKLIPRYYPRSKYQDTLFTLCCGLIQPNIYLLEERTRRSRRETLQNVGAVTHVINKGDIVIQRGEEVTPYIAKAIESINARAHSLNFLRLIGDAIFVILVFLFVFLYVRKISPDFAFTSSGIILISLPVLIALLIERVLLMYLPGEQISGYLFPAGAIGMLAIILLNPRIAFGLVVLGVLLFGLSVDFDFRYMVVALFGGITALLSLYTVRERKEVLMAGFKTALVNFIVIILINLIDDPTTLHYNYAAVGVLNGILCAFITLPSLPLFEYLFGIVTDVRLLELTGIYQPLMREIEEKTPGSYQHSLNVAKLAEPAAQAIGCNYLLVRAGAYYHDIGKILKPKYYTENQVSPDEKKIHQNLSPNMSMLIVRNHVKEGIELAKKYSLPQKIIDFIPQHHGTSLIKYFYQRALQQYDESESNVPVREEDFRYLGPKPQTIEAAIVMLADAVEATATSKLNQPHVSKDDIHRVVHETIVDKFNDGQMDECPLTLRELHIISESFVSTLKSRFHFRVEYPSTPVQKEIGKAMNDKSELSTSKF